MFTVCPKCALTLVVTAADLRIAQGYVRCGRCSNVFNALARLSDDRQSAAAAAAAQSESVGRRPADPTQKGDTSATARARQLLDLDRASRDVPPESTDSLSVTPAATATGRNPAPAFQPPPSSTTTQRQLPATSATTTQRQLPPTSATATQRELPAGATAPITPPPAPASPASASPPAPESPSSAASIERKPPSASVAAAPAAPSQTSFDEETDEGEQSIPDDALEFDPSATDVTKVFVEQAPSPEFTAATGTFKALRLEAEEAARATEQSNSSAPVGGSTAEHLGPVEAPVDVEIDPEVLATMAQLAKDDPEPIQSPTRNLRAPETNLHPAPEPRAALPPPGRPETATTSAVPSPPNNSPPRPQTVAKDADDAKMRAEVARAALESAEAIRAMLKPRKAPTQTEPEPEEDTRAPFGSPRVWAGGSAALVLLLAIQVVHHYRNELAANAQLNGPLTSLYGSLGMKLVPQWDLGAYEVRQLGASTDADTPGQITVRASVKNDAHQSQPLPLLRVTLQDRFGNRIAARDVPPGSYLPRTLPGTSVLSAGQRIDAEMAFVDPGENAVGFEIDACLPAPGGSIACANDIAAR